LKITCFILTKLHEANKTLYLGRQIKSRFISRDRRRLWNGIFQIKRTS